MGILAFTALTCEGPVTLSHRGVHGEKHRPTFQDENRIFGVHFSELPHTYLMNTRHEEGHCTMWLYGGGCTPSFCGATCGGQQVGGFGKRQITCVWSVEALRIWRCIIRAIRSQIGQRRREYGRTAGFLSAMPDWYRFARTATAFCIGVERCRCLNNRQVRSAGGWRPSAPRTHTK
jgi:hypothetical protein